MVAAFSSLVRILGECSTIHSLPVLFFFSKVEIASCTLIPLFMQGSAHSGWLAQQADWGRTGQESLLVRVPDLWSKGCKFESWQEQWDLIRCLFLPHVITAARKRPWSFCLKCRLQITPMHAHTLDPMKSEGADYAAVQAQCGNLSRNKHTRNLSGNI